MGPWYSLPYWRKRHLLKLAEAPKSQRLRCLNLCWQGATDARSSSCMWKRMSCVCGTLALRILKFLDRMVSKSHTLKARSNGLEGRSITMVTLPSRTCLPVPMTSTVCSTTTACCLRMSATRLHCASCHGAPFECLTPLVWKVGQHFLLSKLEPNQYGWQSRLCETLSQTLQKHSFQKTYQNKFSTS